jgi:hypothetical protein
MGLRLCKKKTRMCKVSSPVPTLPTVNHDACFMPPFNPDRKEVHVESDPWAVKSTTVQTWQVKKSHGSDAAHTDFHGRVRGPAHAETPTRYAKRRGEEGPDRTGRQGPRTRLTSSSPLERLPRGEKHSRSAAWLPQNSTEILALTQTG